MTSCAAWRSVRQAQGHLSVLQQAYPVTFINIFGDMPPRQGLMGKLLQ